MPNRIALLVAVGIAYVGVGCSSAKNVVKTEPAKPVIQTTQPEDYYNQGISSLKSKDQDRALASFRQAITKATKDPAKLVDAYYNIGVVLVKQGDLSGAQKAFEKVLSLKPDHRDALLNLGVVLKHKKDFTGAIKQYREALKKAPRDPLIMNNLIVVYRLNKQYSEAEKTGYRLLARAQNNVEAYKNISLIYYDQGKYEMAELLCINAGKMLEKQRQKDPSVKDDPGIYNNLGMIYLRMGKPRDALTQFNKALSVDPNSLDALINSGAIAHQYRDYQRAMSVYEKVLKLQPQNPIALKGLAYAYYGAGKAQEALDLLGRVLTTNADDYRSLFVMGEIYNVFLHDYSKALEYYKKYKEKKGAALQGSDPVNNQIQAVTSKLEMAEQLRKDEEEAQKKEELRKKALEKGKAEQEADKEKGEQKLKDLLKTGEEPEKTEKPGEAIEGQEGKAEPKEEQSKTGGEEAKKEKGKTQPNAGEVKPAEGKPETTEEKTKPKPKKEPTPAGTAQPEPKNKEGDTKDKKE